MILNRKSTKITSQVSLVIAIAMILTLTIGLHTHSFATDTILVDGSSLCKAGLVELFSMLLW